MLSSSMPNNGRNISFIRLMKSVVWTATVKVVNMVESIAFAQRTTKSLSSVVVLVVVDWAVSEDCFVLEVEFVVFAFWRSDKLMPKLDSICSTSEGRFEKSVLLVLDVLSFRSVLNDGEIELSKLESKPLVLLVLLVDSESLPSGSRFELSPECCASSLASRRAVCLARAAVTINPGARCRTAEPLVFSMGLLSARVVS